MHATMKGIGIGPNHGTEVDIPPEGDVCMYLQSYWQSSNLLHDSINLFKNRIEVLRGVVVDAIHYCIHDFVVVENNDRVMPLLECKIVKFFFHALVGHYQIFFKGYFFAQIEGIVDECTGMDTVEAEARGTCILLGQKLLHKFSPHAAPLQANCERAMVTFELQDLVVRNHLLVPRKPGCYSPWPMTEDIVIISLPSSVSDSTLYLAYVVQVHYSNDNRHNGDNQLEVVWVISD